MGTLAERVAVITGAGRGLGREHALLLAAEGALVVVNDVGGSVDGVGSDAGPAASVAEEIRTAGGEAIANTDDISDYDGAGRLIQTAIDEYERVDVLINNAGILRDRFTVNMTIDEWDAVIRVHLRGHFCTLSHAAAHWRARSKAGEQFDASVINTASPVGLTVPNPGQLNYAAAKAGIAAMSQVAAAELFRYGVRVNAIAPSARTRMTVETPGLEAMMAKPESPDAFDAMDPANVSPLVAYLASAACTETGQVLAVRGGSIRRLAPWGAGDEILALDRRPTVEEVAAAFSRHAGRPEEPEDAARRT
jgi:NAD(P)-dependent dehydrogenase (short-subunit alcohol dehydrogenase family)